MTHQVNDQIAEIYTVGWSRIVATMIRFTGGNWDLAEECAQDAFAQAVQKWPTSGVPDQPLAWLTRWSHGAGKAELSSGIRPSPDRRRTSFSPAPAPIRVTTVVALKRRKVGQQVI